MASLSDARLSIELDLPGNSARVIVTCDVRFTRFEQAQIRDGLRFRLDCQIWGEDNGRDAWIDADDHLFNYTSIFFPDATPAALERARFDTTVHVATLQEDSGTDEIYGQLILRNLDSGRRVRRKTNLVHHQFDA
jgi:hypothetical protein